LGAWRFGGRRSAANKAVEHYAAKRAEVRSRRSEEQEAICTQISRIYSKQL